MQNECEDAILAECRIRNVHFLLLEQVELLEQLSGTGRDTAGALDLLRRLMNLDSGMHAGRAPVRAACEAPPS